MAKAKLVNVEPRNKIVVLKPAVNPVRQGTERHKRVEAVLRAKTVDAALRNGAMRSTVAFCQARRLIRIVK